MPSFLEPLKNDFKTEFNLLNTEWVNTQNDLNAKIRLNREKIGSFQITSQNTQEFAIFYLNVENDYLLQEVKAKENRVIKTARFIEIVARALNEAFTPHTIDKINTLTTTRKTDSVDQIDIANDQKIALKHRIQLLDNAIKENDEKIIVINHLFSNLTSNKLKDHVDSNEIPFFFDKNSDLGKSSQSSELKFYAELRPNYYKDSGFNEAIAQNLSLTDKLERLRLLLKDHVISFAVPKGTPVKFRIKEYQKNLLINASEFFKNLWNGNFNELNSVITFEETDDLQEMCRILGHLFHQSYEFIQHVNYNLFKEDPIRAIRLVEQFRIERLKPGFLQWLIKIIPEFDYNSHKELLKFLIIHPHTFVAKDFPIILKTILGLYLENLEAFEELVDILGELKLKELDLSCASIRNEHLLLLSKLKLSSLNIDDCHSISRFEIIGKFQMLETLSCNFFTNDLTHFKGNFSFLFKLMQLRHLSFNILKLDNEELLKTIAQLPLESLSLEQSKIDCSLLVNMKSLKKLSLKNCISSKHASLQQLPLTDLDLTNVDLRVELFSLPLTLKRLNLTKTIYDYSLLKDLSELEELNLSHCRIYDDTVQYYITPLNLKILNLSYCPGMTTKTIEMLGKKNNLELNLSYTNIKEISPEIINGLNLKKLFLFGCFIDENSLTRLKTKFSDFSLSEPIVHEPAVLEKALTAARLLKIKPDRSFFLDMVNNMTGRLHNFDLEPFLNKHKDRIEHIVGLLYMLNRHHVLNLALDINKKLIYTSKLAWDENWVVSFFNEFTQSKNFTIHYTDKYINGLTVSSGHSTSDLNFYMDGKIIYGRDREYYNLVDCLDKYQFDILGNSAKNWKQCLVN